MTVMAAEAAVTEELGWGRGARGGDLVHCVHRELVETLRAGSRGVPRGERVALTQSLAVAWGRLRDGRLLIPFCNDLVEGELERALQRVASVAGSQASTVLTRLLSGANVKDGLRGRVLDSEAA